MKKAVFVAACQIIINQIIDLSLWNLKSTMLFKDIMDLINKKLSIWVRIKIHIWIGREFLKGKLKS